MTTAKNNPINQKRKITIFSDFDGTIFMQDTGHVLVDAHGCGAEYRNRLEEQFKSGERTFRDISEDMWGSMTIPFDDDLALIVKNGLEIDPGFVEFHQYCVDNGFPFNVISAGLKPVLKRVLDAFLGEKAATSIDIIANDALLTAAPGSPWKPIWRDETHSGHDKAMSMHLGRAQAQKESMPDEIPLIVFIGDGVSDLAAAGEADVLFARRGLRLEQHCIEHNIPYKPFTNFLEIKREIEAISREDQQKTGGVGKPVPFNPRANMWRAISSKNAVPTLMTTATPSREEKMFLWPDTFTQSKGSTQPTDGGKEENVLP
ncbi:2,3-diketo-5-methylthio-1-phosphopentane phosphatase [Aspergillus sp. HF37]|nr:2,3-diketo-5-methylthio-1-phosphopentane phosphatase [Aspergillus sp. HF37]